MASHASKKKIIIPSSVQSLICYGCGGGGVWIGCEDEGVNEATLQMPKNLVINLCTRDLAVCPVAAFSIIGLCQLQELNSINAELNIDTRLPTLREGENFLSCSVTLLDLALLLNYD
jgi:hypothetical protein